MRIASDNAFVLHARAWRETSLLVEALCADHGRIGLVARGVSTPKRHALRAALQPIVKPHVSNETWGLPYRTHCTCKKTKRAQKWLPE